MRLTFIDAIKAVGCVLVVLYHISGNYESNFRIIGTSDWWVASLLHSLSHIGVPLFIMASGYILLRSAQTDELGYFIKRRMSKIAVPFIAWVSIYIAWKVLYLDNDIGVIGVLKMAASGTASPHLWFLYMIVGLYLATPILAGYLKHSGERGALYIILIWLAFNTAVPLANVFFDVRVNIYGQMFSGHVGLFVLGYYLRFVGKFDRKILLAVAVLSITFTAVATYLLNQESQSFNRLLENTLLPNNFITAIAIFLLLRDTELSPRVGFAATAISALSFGVYLIHPIFIQLIRSNGFVITSGFGRENPIVEMAIAFPVALTLSFISVFAIRTIPILKKISP